MTGKRPHTPSSDEFDVFEYRPGKYVKIQQGRVVSRATQEELARLNIRRRVGIVDTGLMEVALALSAVSALLASSENAFIIRLFATGGFALSSLGAALLFWSYFLQKAPEHLVDEFLQETQRRGLVGHYVFFRRYFVLLVKHLYRPSLVDSHEFGYLNLLAAFLLIWCSLIAWVLYSFVRVDSMLPR
jgi:hypothetical protein